MISEGGSGRRGGKVGSTRRPKIVGAPGQGEGDHDWLDPGVIPAALTRAVLVGRAAATVTAAGAGVLLVADPRRLVNLVIAVVVATLVEIAALTRWPGVVRWPVAIIVIDSLGLLGLLALGGPGIAYFCYAGGCAALAGALLGLRAVPFWALQAALGFAVAARVLETTRPVSDLAVFVLTFPTGTVVVGIGLAGIRNALVRYVEMTAGLMASVQRSAAASERSRLARELHDSVAKTLRAVSFAAIALPASMRRHSALAERLADTVSEGARAAASQARQLVEGLRLDRPEAEFVHTIAVICRDWSARSGIGVRLDLEPVEPSIPVRYELTRILHEALVNVERHARASGVMVALTRVGEQVRLAVSDDGRGMARRPAGPQSGHFGIVGMSERARTVGGSLRMSSIPGGGSEVSVTVPLRLDGVLTHSTEGRYAP